MNNDDYDYDFIKDAIEQYDIYENKLIDFLKKIEYLKIINYPNLTPKIQFFDGEKKLLLESSFENIGIYKQKNNIWKWGWSMNTINNNQNSISRNILLYSFKLRSDINKEFLLKSILLESTIEIKNKLQLDILLAISSYLSKFYFIFKLPIVPNIDEEFINYKNLFTDVNINQCEILYLIIIDYNFNHDSQY